MKPRLFVIIALLNVGCASSGGIDGRDALVNVAEEPPGSACEFGGVKIDSGLDRDGDGELAPTEIDDTQYVCDADATDPPTRTRASEEPAGENCGGGGVRLEFGIDTDENGSLSDDEVEDTEYVCNGTDGLDGEEGTDGLNGTDGVDGADGADGAPGADGTSYLTDVTSEPAGANCSDGGIRVEVGPDDNSNGVLDAAEVTTTEYVCHGTDGAGSSGSEVVTQYDEASVASTGSAVTLVSATISVAGPGIVVAFGETDAFCTTSGPTDHDCDAGGLTPGFVRIVDTPTGSVTTGDGHGYFWLNDDTTETVHRSNVFTVGSAGTYTYYFRGEAQLGEIGFWRNQLTLVYLAD